MKQVIFELGFLRFFSVDMDGDILSNKDVKKNGIVKRYVNLIKQ